jgi:AraC-like DNA-binding protein
MSFPRFPMSSQRLGTLAVLRALLQEMDVDPAPVFAGSGIDPETITPDTHAPLEVALTVLDRAVEATECDHLGLLLRLRFTLDKHGMIGRLMRTAPTLYDALADYVSWQHGYSTGSIVYLARMGDDHAFGFGVHVPRSVVSHNVYDFVSGVGVRMLGELTGHRAAPVELHLSRREPAPGSPHTRLLRFRVAFNRPLNCLMLDAAGLRTPRATHDPDARRTLLAAMEGRMMGARGYSAQVRRAIRRALLVTAPRMPHVEDDLCVHPRTLRRRLSEEGTTFDDLLDEVRQTMARELIELTDMPMSEVGDALAFASPGVFTDWFRRVFGVPPSGWPRQREHQVEGI